MSKKSSPSLPAWLKVVAGLAVAALAATAPAGHAGNVPTSRPATSCVELRVV